MRRKRRKPSFLGRLTSQKPFVDRKMTRLCRALEDLDHTLEDWGSRCKKKKGC